MGKLFDPNQELKEPWIFESPSDDAAPFFHQLALPASDMYYGADYGMYHSIYENFHWMKTVVDPTFEYHIAMALLQGFVALRLANADLIPLDYAGEASYWRMAYRSLASSAKEKEMEIPMFARSMALIDEWEKEALAFRTQGNSLLKSAPPSALSETRLSELNRKLFLIARDFYRKEGLPGAELERNLWSGAGGILPGLQSAVSKGNSDLLLKEAELYNEALEQRIKSSTSNFPPGSRVRLANITPHDWLRRATHSGRPYNKPVGAGLRLARAGRIKMQVGRVSDPPLQTLFSNRLDSVLKRGMGVI